VAEGLVACVSEEGARASVAVVGECRQPGGATIHGASGPMTRRQLEPARLRPIEKPPTQAAPALAGMDEARRLIPALAVVAVVPLHAGVADELVAAPGEDQVRRRIAVIEVAVEGEHPVERVPVDLAVDP